MYRFGGPKHLALLLKKIGKPRDASNLYRWTYPKSRGGTGGLVPGDVWPDIFVAARLEGIILTLEDTDPREIYIKDWDGKNK